MFLEVTGLPAYWQCLLMGGTPLHWFMRFLYVEVEADNSHFSAPVCHWTCLWLVACTFSTNNAVPSMIDMALIDLPAITWSSLRLPGNTCHRIATYVTQHFCWWHLVEMPRIWITLPLIDNFLRQFDDFTYYNNTLTLWPSVAWSKIPTDCDIKASSYVHC